MSTRILALALSLLALGACGGGNDVAAPTSPPTTGPAPLVVLVTNDDGVGAPGIDALVEALEGLPAVDVQVVAPKANQSGTGVTRSDGAVSATDATTASGHAATAVDGTPADSVAYALDVLGIDPDLVVSGSNEGQNIGVLTQLSGTVGAARTAAGRGIPAVAVSQGLAPGDGEEDYEVGIARVLAWIAEHRRDVLAGTLGDPLVSINAPTCPTGAVRGDLEVPVAGEGEGQDLFTVDCRSTLADPADDVTAFVNGFVTITALDPDEWAVPAS